MSQGFKRGNAGVTVLVIVVILIVAGILFFVNRKDQAVQVDVNATTTPATTTMMVATTTQATTTGSMLNVTASGTVNVQ